MTVRIAARRFEGHAAVVEASPDAHRRAAIAAKYGTTGRRAGCATRSPWPSTSSGRWHDRACTPVDFRPMPTFQRPARHPRPAARRAGRWTRLERLAADLAAALRLPADRDPDVRADGGVRTGDRRGHRRRREGAVPDRAADRGGRSRGRCGPEPTAGHRPRLHPARDADAAAAGEADDDRADVPLRPAPGRPLPAVLAVRRRGDRRPGPGRSTPRSSSSATASTRGRRRGRRGRTSTRSATPPAARPTSRSWPRTTAATSTTCRRWSATGSSATPLRLLDSKDPAMAALNAARAADHRPAVRGVRRALRGASRPTSTRSASPIASSPRLVRGLDYYTRTAFEFYVAGREGQQQALGGGGRYDGLVELLGGRPTPGIGFGLGLDRVVLALEEQGVAPTRRDGPAGRRRRRRSRGHRRAPEDRHGPPGGAAAGPGRSRRRKLGRQLEAAGKDGAHFAVILGDELARRPGPAPRPAGGHPARSR